VSVVRQEMINPIKLFMRVLLDNFKVLPGLNHLKYGQIIK